MRVVDRLVLTLLTFGRKVEPQEATPAAKMCKVFLFHFLLTLCRGGSVIK